MLISLEASSKSDRIKALPSANFHSLVVRFSSVPDSVISADKANFSSTRRWTVKNLSFNELQHSWWDCVPCVPTFFAVYAATETIGCYDDYAKLNSCTCPAYSLCHQFQKLHHSWHGCYEWAKHGKSVKYRLMFMADLILLP